MLRQGCKQVVVLSRHAWAEVSLSEAGITSRLALLAVRAEALTAVPVGTRLPLRRILLGGGDGSFWFSGMVNSGSCGSKVSAMLFGLSASADGMPVPPCTQCKVTVVSQVSCHFSHGLSDLLQQRQSSGLQHKLVQQPTCRL